MSIDTKPRTRSRSNTTRLRNSKSSTTLATNPVNNNSNTNNTKSGKLGSFFRKASTEWNLFITKVKSIGDEVFTEDQIIKDLFVESDTDYLLDKLDRLSKGYSVNEERFLSQYQQFKNLDKMYEIHQQRMNNTTEDIKSSSTVFSESHNRVSLKDIIRQTNSSSSTPIINDETNNRMRLEPGLEPGDIDTELLDDIEDVEDDDDLDEDASNDLGDKALMITFHDLDVVKLKEQYDDNRVKPNNNSQDISDLYGTDANIGDILWEYRRTLWLKSPKPDDNCTSSCFTNSNGGRSNSRLMFEQIPKESYVKIYSNLVEKSKALKAGKRLNLYDLIRVVNAGWEADEKWERAAKGLP